MNAPEGLRSTLLADVQGAPDDRKVVIQRVGVKSVRHPLVVRAHRGAPQSTVGLWSLDVELPAENKGTHMSRFIELLGATQEPLDAPGLRRMLADLVHRLDAQRGRISVSFPFFVEKRAPVSGVASLLDYEVTLTGRIDGEALYTSMTVVAPVTSLCPCSKEISEYGAHNQRSHVTIEVALAGDLAIEELLSIAEQEASSELYGLLKRPDEKYVTERAYDNPKFVEDLVRDVAGRLALEERIGCYAVEVENFESIHNHSAFARIESGPRPSRGTSGTSPGAQRAT
jgi:GTP cyclohydrolase I